MILQKLVVVKVQRKISMHENKVDLFTHYYRIHSCLKAKHSKRIWSKDFKASSGAGSFIPLRGQQGSSLLRHGWDSKWFILFGQTGEGMGS
jgi:hypothetical protein